ncbi:NUDIX domain-containing protein [Negadavirga shengliensis]|uniref:NUDIX domain-containing protein n=1 Tax=Negadavirga shengliensis TaxID=1389218 RepID=A0ABV9T127_9BACT
MDHTTQILPAVAAVIFNEAGEVLLQKRKDVEKWCVISGHVEFGETVEQAVLREIEEETGKKASIIRLIGVYSSPGSQTYFYREKTIQYVTTYFEAVLDSEIEKGFKNQETVELKYFHSDHIPADLALINPNWLKDALDRTVPAFVR